MTYGLERCNQLTVRESDSDPPAITSVNVTLEAKSPSVPQLSERLAINQGAKSTRRRVLPNAQIVASIILNLTLRFTMSDKVNK